MKYYNYNPTHVFFMSIIILFLTTSTIFCQDPLEVKQSDSTRALVICYLEPIANKVDVTDVYGEGCRLLKIIHRSILDIEISADTASPSLGDVYGLIVESLPVLGVEWKYTPPGSGVTVKPYLYISEFEDGWLLCFTNVPPGSFIISKIQAAEQKYAPDNHPWIDIYLSIEVQPCTVNYMGAFKAKYGFNKWIEKTSKWGEVIVQNLYIDYNQKGEIITTNNRTDVEYIALDTPTQVQMIEELLDDAEGAWKIMLEKRLEELSK